MLRLFIYFHGKQPQVRQGLLIIEVSRSHSETPQSVGLLWTSDQPDAETSKKNQRSQETFKQLVGFEITIPASERPHAHALEKVATSNVQVTCTIIFRVARPPDSGSRSH
jgi:hypothetical protein